MAKDLKQYPENLYLRGDGVSSRTVFLGRRDVATKEDKVTVDVPEYNFSVEGERIGIQVANVAALATLNTTNLTDNRVIFVQGYTTAGDGGHQFVRYMSTGRSGLTANEKDIFHFYGAGTTDYYEVLDKTVVDCHRAGCTVFDTDPGAGNRTSSATKLQAIVDLAVATSRPVQLRYGFVYTDTTITIDDNRRGMSFIGNSVGMWRNIATLGQSPPTDKPTFASTDRDVTLFKVTDTPGQTTGNLALVGIGLTCTDQVGGPRTGIGLEMASTAWMSGLRIYDTHVSWFNYGVLAGAAGIGNLKIDNVHFHNNLTWGIKIIQSVNALSITKAAIRNNGGASPTDYFDPGTGGLWLTAATGGNIQGSFEGQQTGVRMTNSSGFTLQGYFEASASAAFVLDGCQGFTVLPSYLDKPTRAAAALLSCWDGQIKANDDMDLYVFHCRNIDVDPEWIKPYRLNTVETIQSDAAVFCTDAENVSHPWSSGRLSPRQDSTASTATYTYSTDINPPFGYGKVWKLTSSGVGGSLRVGLNSGTPVTGKAGEWVCGSVYAYIPTGNTLYGGGYMRGQFRLTLDANPEIDEIHFIADDIITSGRWILCRWIHRLAADADVLIMMLFYNETNTEDIYLYSPQCGVYSTFPWNPRPIVQTPTKKFPALDETTYLAEANVDPTDGTWAVRDRILYATPAASSSPGSVCTAAPTTFKAMPDLKA